VIVVLQVAAVKDGEVGQRVQTLVVMALNHEPVIVRVVVVLGVVIAREVVRVEQLKQEVAVSVKTVATVMPQLLITKINVMPLIVVSMFVILLMAKNVVVQVVLSTVKKPIAETVLITVLLL
jgi:hypothetical protein